MTCRVDARTEVGQPGNCDRSQSFIRVVEVAELENRIQTDHVSGLTVPRDGAFLKRYLANRLQL